MKIVKNNELSDETLNSQHHFYYWLRSTLTYNISWLPIKTNKTVHEYKLIRYLNTVNYNLHITSCESDLVLNHGLNRSNPLRFSSGKQQLELSEYRD